MRRGMRRYGFRNGHGMLRNWTTSGCGRKRPSACDRAYLEWRYANNPLIDYSLFGVYDHDEPVGWLVTSDRGLSGAWDDEVRVHDMLIAPGMRLPALQKAASVLHAKSLVLWLPAHCVEPGMESRESNWKVMYHPLNDAVSQEFLTSNIYYTLGEADEWWW